MKTNRRSFLFTLVSTTLTACISANKIVITSNKSKANNQTSASNTKAIAGVAVAGKAIAGNNV